MGILDFFRKKKKEPERPFGVDSDGEANITIVPKESPKKKTPPRKPGRKSRGKVSKRKRVKRSKPKKKK